MHGDAVMIYKGAALDDIHTFRCDDMPNLAYASVWIQKNSVFHRVFLELLTELETGDLVRVAFSSVG